MLIIKHKGMKIPKFCFAFCVSVIYKKVNIRLFWGVYKVVLAIKDKRNHYPCVVRDGS